MTRVAKRTTAKKITKAKKASGKATLGAGKASSRTAKKTATKTAKRVSAKGTKRTLSKKKLAAPRKSAAKEVTDRKAALPSSKTRLKATASGSSNSSVRLGKKRSPAKSVPVAPSATSQDPIQFPQDRPLPKTHLTAKELRQFKELLLVKRAELVGDVQRLSNQALSNDARGQGEQSAMPIHMADVGSDNWEQEFTLGLLANEEALVREIDNALERIHKKAYGVCLATGKKISHARLRAKPWAQYCIEYARAREEGRAM